jgi:predicted histone-like DNA-binding protein
MAVKYRITERRDLLDPSKPNKYYAYLVNADVVDLKTISAAMSDGSTLREADIYAVLIGLVNTIQVELEKGNQVNLGDLGSFYLSINSKGELRPDDVKPQSIQRVKLLYRPKSKMKRFLKSLSFKKDPKSKG